MADFNINISDSFVTRDALSRPSPVSIVESVNLAHTPYVDESLVIQSVSDSVNALMQTNDLTHHQTLTQTINSSENKNTNTLNIPSSASVILLSENNSGLASNNIQSDSSTIQLTANGTQENVVTIVSPTTGAIYKYRDSILFSMTYNKNGVAILPTGIRWTSNIDGVFAMDNYVFSYNLLSKGSHVIRIYDINEKEIAYVNITVSEVSVPTRPENLTTT